MTTTLVTRDEVTSLKDKRFNTMLECEVHHDHKIVKVNGVLRWKQNDIIRQRIHTANLNQVAALLSELG